MEVQQSATTTSTSLYTNHACVHGFPINQQQLWLSGHSVFLDHQYITDIPVADISVTELWYCFSAVA